MPVIRRASADDSKAIWSILEPAFRAGDTYTVARDMSESDGIAYWCAPAHEVFVAEEGNQVLGTYYLQANQPGGGSHVANCGYVTAAKAQGRGIARAMLEHSLARARERGFLAMQYNFVVSTNTRAAKIWEANGFTIVGRLQKAFNHPTLGYVDALVMYRLL